MTRGPESTATGAPHEARWADDAAAYAIGALDAAERVEYEAHLAGCGVCAADVQACRDVVPLLALGAPGGDALAAPSPALRARIVAAATAEARGEAPQSPTAQESRAEAPTLQAPTLQVLRPRSSAARPAAPAFGQGAARRAPWLAAAAALVLAAGLGAGWSRERQVRVAERRESVRSLQALAARVARRSALIDSARDSLLAALTAPDVRMARLAVAGEPAAARLIWSPRQGVVLLTASAMPRPQAGRTYQLWGIPRGGRPQSLGTFAPAEDGRVQAVLRVPPEAEMRVAAVTEEPEGGSPQPTGRPLMSGEIAGE